MANALDASLELQKWSEKRGLSDNKKTSVSAKSKLLKFLQKRGSKQKDRPTNEKKGSTSGVLSGSERAASSESIEANTAWPSIDTDAIEPVALPVKDETTLDWLDEDEQTRVKQMFKIPRSKTLVDISHGTLNTITDQKQMLHKQGTICLFQGYVCFFEYLPSCLKDFTIKEGHLEKFSERLIRRSKMWTSYYFVLDNDKLSFYQSIELRDSYTTVGVIPLRDIHSIVKCRTKNREHGFRIITSSKVHYIACASDAEVDEWTEAIKNAQSKKSRNSNTNVTVLIPLKYVLSLRKISTFIYPNGICITTEENEFVFSSFPEYTWKTFTAKLMHEWDTAKKGSLKKSLSPAIRGADSDTKDTEDSSSDSSDSEMQDENPQPSQSEKMEFQQRFHLPDTENLLAVYNCAMLRSILVQGKIYISTNYICFYAKNLGVVRVVIIPFRDVVKVEKEKFQTHWLLNAIVITTVDKTFYFGSFLNRRSALATLRKGLKSSFSGPASKSKITISCDTESFGDIEELKFNKSMKITMLIVGTRGDVQPFIALALALEREGHKVRIGTHEAHRSFVTKWGLDFYPLAGDPKQLLKLFVENPNMFSVSFARECINYLDFIEQLLTTCWEAVIDGSGTDAIIQNPAAFGAAHSAEKLGIPSFVAFTFPWSRTTEFPHPFAIPRMPMGPFYNYSSYVAVEQALWLPLVTKINSFRKEVLGLPSLDLSEGGSIINERQIPHLYCWSPSVLPKPADWADHIAVTGYWFLPADNWTPPQDLVDFLKKEPKPIYIGFGSVNVNDPDKLTRTIIKALSKTKQRAVLMKSWGGTESISKYPDLIYPLESAPHDWLFPRVAAVIHHGGAGTTAEGLRAGIPTMIVPFFGDQYLWASRIEELGLGIAPFTLKRMTTDKLAAAVTKLVTDKQLKARSAAMGENIRSQDGLARAVEFFHRHLKRSLDKNIKLIDSKELKVEELSCDSSPDPNLIVE